MTGRAAGAVRSTSTHRPSRALSATASPTITSSWPSAKVAYGGRSNEILHRDPSLNAPEVRRIIGYPGGHVEGYPDTFRALFSQVYADIGNGAPAAEAAYPTFRDGLDALAVTEAIAKSSAERRWVAVER